jgi:hypothetical protein
MNKIKPSIFLSTILIASNLYSVDITDYKVVDSYYQDAYLNGNLNVNSGNQEQTSYDLHIDANFKTLQSTLPYSWDLEVIGNSDFNRGENEEDDSQESYNTIANAHFDKYIDGNEKLFVYGATKLGYQKVATADDADDPYVKVGAGLGWGRVYNATPLAKALRIVEDLIKYKVINKDLSKKAYINLAGVIDRQDEFKSKYSPIEYKKYWYEAMEKVFKEDGVLDKDSLGAFGIVRIDEILNIEKVSNRIHGWKVRGGFGKILSNYDGDSQDPTVDGEFEFGLPIGLSSQFSERIYIEKLLDSDTDTEFSLTNSMIYTYEISNKIDWDNSWVIEYQANDKADDIINNSLSTGFIYYLPNRLNLTATLSISKRDGGIDEEDNWNKKFVAGIQYRLK